MTFKKFLKWTSIVLGVLIAVLLIANAVFVWRSSVALERRLQAIRDAGDPVSMSDLARRPMPPEDNAATFLRRAEKDLHAIDKDLAAFYESEAYKNDELGPAELHTLASVLDAHPETMSLVEQSAACPGYDPQIDGTLDTDEFLTLQIERFGALKGAVRILRYRTLVLLARGQRDEAAEAAIRFLQLSRHFDNEPMIIGHLMSIACRSIAYDAAHRVLRSGPIPDAARDAFDAELAQHDPWGAFAWALKSERAFGLAAMNSLPMGKVVRSWPARGFWNNAQVYYLDVLHQQIALVESPTAVGSIGHTRVPRSASPWCAMTDMVLPAIQSASHATRAHDRHAALPWRLECRHAARTTQHPGNGPSRPEAARRVDYRPVHGHAAADETTAGRLADLLSGADARDDGGKLANDGQCVAGTDVGFTPIPAVPSLEYAGLVPAERPD